MKRHVGLIVLALLVLIGLLVYTVSYVVDETTDFAVVTTFGKVAYVVDGKKDPGLHFKWPWPIQRLTKYDYRQHVLVAPFRQIQIDGKYNITATVFCTWKIDDPEVFYRRKKTLEGADEVLRSQLNSKLTGVFGSVRMGELVNTDPKKMRLTEIEAEIKKQLVTTLRDEYGIEVINVGIQSLGLPESVSSAVITAMTEERGKEISRYQAAGKATADAIVGRATAARDKILAFARRKAGDIETQGEAKAAEAYAEFREAPEFSMFLRSVESMRVSLKDRTVFLLDPTTMPILRFLRVPPTLDTTVKKPLKPAPR